MKYTKLGRTGCEVSRICLGTMNFGGLTDEQESFTIMDCAFDGGVNFFDTADNYNNGFTEEIIGRWLKQSPGRRDDIVLATKVRNPIGQKPNEGSGLSAYKIKRQIERSLKRLGTDHVDLYQMHGPDPSVGWDEIWGAFEDLVHAGKVVYVGSSNHLAWEIAKGQGVAGKRGFQGLVSEQHNYSLLYRFPELEILPCCKKLGLGLLAYSPIGGGLLGGNTFNAPQGTRSAEDHIQEKTKKLNKQLKEYCDLCKSIGHSQADVAVAWLLHQGAVTGPIVGPRTVEQMKGNLRAVEIELDKETLEQINKIFPNDIEYY